MTTRQQQQQTAGGSEITFDFDCGELLVFQESTDALVFPPKACHRFGRFPPPPSRFARGSSVSPLSTSRSSREGEIISGGGGGSSSSQLILPSLKTFDDIHWSLVNEAAFYFPNPAQSPPLQSQQALQQLQQGFSPSVFVPSPSSSSSSLEVSDRTLIVLSIGCRYFRVDVGIAFWYSNSELGIKPSSWFAFTNYLVEFLKYSVQELGLSVSHHVNSATTAGGGSGAGTARSQPDFPSLDHHHQQSNNNNNNNMFFSSPESIENFHEARNSLKSRVRQLLSRNSSVNFPVTVPRAVMKSAREMVVGSVDEALKHSWEAARAFLFLTQYSNSNQQQQQQQQHGHGVGNISSSSSSSLAASGHSTSSSSSSGDATTQLHFATSVIGYCLALSRNSPLEVHNNNSTNENDFLSLFYDSSGSGSGYGSGSASGYGSGYFQPSSSVATAPGGGDENNDNSQQQQPKSLPDLISSALRYDLEHCTDCTSRQKSLVKVDALMEAILFVRRHPAKARIIILSRRDNREEDYTAACLFNVLRALFRPHGRFAHSRDSGVFARKISEKDGAKPGMLWGNASWWTPLTHIEFSSSFGTLSGSSSGSAGNESAVLEEVFFRSRLLPALEFDHPALIVDCMQKVIFLASPSSPSSSLLGGAVLGGGAGGTTSTPTAASGVGGNLPPPPQQQQNLNNSSSIRDDSLFLASSGSPSVVAASSSSSSPSTFFPSNNASYVLSALPAIPIVVEECKGIYQSQLAFSSNTNQNTASGIINMRSSTSSGNNNNNRIGSSGFIDSSATAAPATGSGSGNFLFGNNNNSNNNLILQQQQQQQYQQSIGVGCPDALKSLAELAPVLRAMAQAECAQLLANQSIMFSSQQQEMLILSQQQQQQQQHLASSLGSPSNTPTSKFNNSRVGGNNNNNNNNNNNSNRGTSPSPPHQRGVGGGRGNANSNNNNNNQQQQNSSSSSRNNSQLPAPSTSSPSPSSSLKAASSSAAGAGRAAGGSSLFPAAQQQHQNMKVLRPTAHSLVAGFKSNDVMYALMA